MKLLSADSFIVRLWHRINTIVYRRADAVITLSEGMAKTLGNRASIPVSVIPPWACVEEVVPIPKSQNPFAIHHSQVDKFTVLYSGNFGKTHPLETLIEVARQLQAYPQIHFLLIGGGVKYAALQQLSSRYRLQNITFLDWLPADQLRFSLPCADVSVVALDDSSGTMSVPSKTFYMLSAGSALLALGSPDSEISRLCAQYHCGQAFLSTQITEISNFLLHLYKNPEKRFQLQYASRQSSLDFTPKNAKDYWKILNKK